MGDVADCAAIELDIENITGVSDANDDFIRSAQKFVVASVPKNLLKWAITETVPATHGGDNDPQQVTLPVRTDNIISVRRDSYAANEVPAEERGFIDNTSSLKKATNIFPKYYIADGNRVIAKPDPDSTYKIYVMYIDYTKINDDSDLRSAVIFHAASSEFTKLAVSKVTDWSDLTLPVAPATPDFGSDLSMSSVPPVAPSSPSFTYTDASVSDIVKPFISISDMDSMTESAPSYTKPVMSLGAAPTISDLSISSVPPVSPSISDNSVSFSTSAPTFVKPIHTSQVAFNDYWTLSDFGDSDPGVLTVSSIIPVPPSAPRFSTPSIATVTVGTMPDISSTTVTNIGTPPTYTAPTVGGATEELTASMTSVADDAIGTDVDFKDFSKWFTAVGEMIEDEEDTELAQAQLQKINTYIQSYSQAMQNQLNTFNDANVEYQAKLQEGIQQAQIDAQKALQQAQIDKEKVVTDAQIEAQEKQQETSLLLQRENQEYAASLQKYSAEVSTYQAEVNKEVQEYAQKFSRYQLELNTVYTAWAKTESDNISKYQADIQNEQALFNENNVEYQAQLQISIQDAQLSSQDDAQKLSKYASELQSYQSELNKEIQEYQQNLAGDLQVWNQERQTDLQKYASDIQNEVSEFNKENVLYQQDIQRKVQNLQKDTQEAVQNAQNDIAVNNNNLQKDVQISLQNAVQDFQQDVQEYSAKVQKYNSELNQYQQDINKEVQDFVNTLNKESQEYQNKIALYNANLQKYQAEVGEKTQKIGSATQNSTFYSNESKKYYEWSQLEISSYIQNNSKMINQTMAAQAAAQQQRR